MNPFYGESKHPFTIGLWKGIDGASIMLAHGYYYGHRWNNEDLSNNKTLLDYSKRTPLNTVYRYYGQVIWVVLPLLLLWKRVLREKDR